MKEINKTKAKNKSLHEMLKSIFLSVNLNGVKNTFHFNESCF